MITIDQLKQVEIKIGEIISAEKIEGADKLFKLMVNFGEQVSQPLIPKDVGAEKTVEVDLGLEISSKETEKDIRQIISGIAPYFPDPSVLIGIKCAFVVNLEPRMIRGFQSNGMILAAGGVDTPFTLLRAGTDTVPGSLVR